MDVVPILFFVLVGWIDWVWCVGNLWKELCWVVKNGRSLAWDLVVVWILDMRMFGLGVLVLVQSTKAGAFESPDILVIRLCMIYKFSTFLQIL